MSMVCAQVLWDNLLFRYLDDLQSSQATIEGFEPSNAADWRDFSLFRPLPGCVLSTTIPSSPIDTVVVWPVAGVVGQIRITDHYGVWRSDPIDLDGSGDIVWTNITAYTFPAGTLSVHFLGATTPDIRQIAIGQRLQFPIGQWAEVNPPRLTQGLVSENLIAVNGSILGRSVRRVEKQGQLSLEHLSPLWVRSTWEPLAAHAARYAFFHRWDPVSYPTEVAFTVANEVQAPKNSKAGLMSVQMPTRFLT